MNPTPRPPSDRPRLLCVGINHASARLEVRERYALSKPAQARALLRAKQNPPAGLHEVAVLSTCNRTELYGVGEDGIDANTLLGLLEHVRVSEGDFGHHGYVKEGAAAQEHLLRVAAGLDSQVLGESEILGQVREMLELAQEVGTLGPVLSKLLQQALHAGKRVRRETGLGDGILSHSSLVARMLNHEAAMLPAPSVLIVGAGSMARSALLGLERERFGRVWVANRTLGRARELAEQAGAEAVGLEAMGRVLREADFVISAVSVERPLLRPEHLGGARQPVALFDLSLPRSIAPSVAELGVRLHTLDDLEAILAVHRAEREAAVPQAERIVAEELRAFRGWLEARAVVPTVKALRQRFEALRQAELEALSPAERAVAERVTHRLVQKLLHSPLTRLRELAEEGEAEPYRQALHALFGLEQE